MGGTGHVLRPSPAGATANWGQSKRQRLFSWLTAQLNGSSTNRLSNRLGQRTKALHAQVASCRGCMRMHGSAAPQTRHARRGEQAPAGPAPGVGVAHHGVLPEAWRGRCGASPVHVLDGGTVHAHHHQGTCSADGVPCCTSCTRAGHRMPQAICCRQPGCRGGHTLTLAPPGGWKQSVYIMNASVAAKAIARAHMLAPMTVMATTAMAVELRWPASRGQGLQRVGSSSRSSATRGGGVA